MLQSRVKAPDFAGAVDWLGVPAPLTMEQLRGKILLLDFWTFCCVDCMHILPYLRKLEEEFSQELVVIGVHSAKFPNEKDSGHIRRAIERYGIEHPVINDARFALWESYWVREWPTLILIDPEGYIVQRVACSEKPYGKFEEPIRELIKEFEASGKLSREPIGELVQHARTRAVPATSVSSADTAVAPGAVSSADTAVAPGAAGFQPAKGDLRYPGKVTCDRDFIYVADTGNHRIAVFTHDGTPAYVVGTGTPGSADGLAHEAQFHSPQGLALANGYLYVADTENHLLRRIDLCARSVTTVAGTGEQSLYTAQTATSGPALAMHLSSPWDLAFLGERLFIAMAGPHQIWCYDPGAQTISLHAGSSVESLKDGKLLEARFAQPSGLTTDGSVLYVADAETSAIRRVDVEKGGNVTTVVGDGLFTFGDRDGVRSEVLLQHPLAVTYYKDELLIADSYNHKLKRVDPKTGTTRTFAGDQAGHEDGEQARFAEPGGLCVLGDVLYVADTNNHSLRKVDIRTGNTSTLVGVSRTWPNLVICPAEPAHVQADADGKVQVELHFSENMHLNNDAPAVIEVRLNGQEIGRQSQTDALAWDLRWPRSSRPLRLEVTAQIVYCAEGNNAACHVRSCRWQLPVTTSNDATGATISLQATI